MGLPCWTVWPLCRRRLFVTLGVVDWRRRTGRWRDGRFLAGPLGTLRAKLTEIRKLFAALITAHLPRSLTPQSPLS